VRPARRAGLRGVGLVELGDTEIRELHIAVARDQDVLRLEIAMNDSLPVHDVEGAAQLLADHHGGLERQRAASLE